MAGMDRKGSAKWCINKVSRAALAPNCSTSTLSTNFELLFELCLEPVLQVNVMSFEPARLSVIYGLDFTEVGRGKFHIACLFGLMGFGEPNLLKDISVKDRLCATPHHRPRNFELTYCT